MEELNLNINGLNFTYRKWTTETPKGIIIGVHGFAEHSGRYDHVGEFFAKNGYSFYMMDLRGHGKSGGLKAYVDNFDTFIKDVDSFVEHVLKEESIDKVFMLGHSMGGLISVRYAAYHPEKLKGIIATGPAIGINADVSKGVVIGAKILSKISPKKTIKQTIDPSILTHDKDISEAYAKDPLVFKETTVKLGAELFRAADETKKKFANKITVPIFLLIGSEDKLADPESVEDFYHRLTIKDKAFKKYDGFYHEIMNEIGRENVLADILEWINAH